MSISPRPQTIQIYLPQGDPAGMRVASMTTRTVRVFDVPRSLVKSFLELPQAKQVGVYFLIGETVDGAPELYIGQTGEIGRRLQEHASKDFWNRALVAISLTNEWTSTHVGFLEWLSIDRAKTANRFTLTNGNRAVNPHTPEPLEADCYEYLDTISVLIATLGFPALDAARHLAAVEGGDELESSRELSFTESGTSALGHVTPDGFLVLAGSTGRTRLRPSAPRNIQARRDALETAGTIEITGDTFSFKTDQLFTSPSSAGQILVGGNINGRATWRDGQGRSLNDLEQDDLTSVNQAGDRTP